jgi:hypothetical protein
MGFKMRIKLFNSEAQGATHGHGIDGKTLGVRGKDGRRR